MDWFLSFWTWHVAFWHSWTVSRFKRGANDEVWACTLCLKTADYYKMIHTEYEDELYSRYGNFSFDWWIMHELHLDFLLVDIVRELFCEFCRSSPCCPSWLQLYIWFNQINLNHSKRKRNLYIFRNFRKKSFTSSSTVNLSRLSYGDSTNCYYRVFIYS